MSEAGPPAPDGLAWRRVCDSADLAEGGDGVRFEWQGPRGAHAAFAVRHRGRVRAYLNRCSHVPVELDWQPGKFLDSSGLYLICATHGALYDPRDGRCVGGPCSGRPLASLAVHEQSGSVLVAMNVGDG